MSIENGDMPAMPVECQFGPDGPVRGQQTGSYSGWEIGLTKRELFAAMAMHALIASGSYEPANPFLFEAAALAADMQLAELAKKGGAL